MLRVATEHMVRAIEEITLHQGIDPRTAVLVGGGGAAGLNSVAIARRLGCPLLIVPALGPALSASGALLSDLTADFAATLMTTTAGFDLDGRLAGRRRAARTLRGVRRRGRRRPARSSSRPRRATRTRSGSSSCRSASRSTPTSSGATSTRCTRRCSRSATRARRSRSSAGAPASAVPWSAGELGSLARDAAPGRARPRERVLLRSRRGRDAGPLVRGARAGPRRRTGPAIVESPVTTVVVDPGATVERRPSGSLALVPVAAPAPAPVEAAA